MKFNASDYKRPFEKWTPPKVVYPFSATEKAQLRHLKTVFDPLPLYKEMETQAAEKNQSVEIDELPVSNAIPFLENTAEKCVSPQTKHSQAGMQSARRWVQRVDTPDGMFRRLTDGYGLSLMFGERCHQYIRNSNNWRGISGVMLDIDIFREPKYPDRPEPVYARGELLERYPLLARVCSFILPSASSLYEGRPFKARGVLFFESPVTDQRVYRAFGDILCGELDCIPPNVTKNPVAVGFGNTHHASDGWRNLEVDLDWIQSALEQAKRTVLSNARKRHTEQKTKAKRAEHYRQQRGADRNGGENISAFIDQCDPVAEMVRSGLLTPGRNYQYRWHESDHERSCDIRDGTIHIFSHSMQAASPAGELEPVGVHRFYLYQLTGLDLTKDSDKDAIREYLFGRGYGDNPKALTAKKKENARRYTVNTEKHHETSTLENERVANQNVLTEWLEGTQQKQGKHLLVLGSAAGTGKTTVAITTAETLLYISKTTEEADQVFQTLHAAEADVHRHRPRLFNHNREDWRTLPLGLTPNDRPCIQPELCNLYAKRGHPTHEVCVRCPVYSACQEDGYLSQDALEKNAMKVVYAWDEAVACDAVHKDRVKRICSKDDILIVDEVNPANLSQDRMVTREMLFDLTERFRDPNTAVEYHILKGLLDAISTASDVNVLVDSWKAQLESIDDIAAFDVKLQKYPVGHVFQTAPEEKPYRFTVTMHYRGKEVTVPVVSHETACDTPVFEIGVETPVDVGNWQLSFFPLSVLIKVGLVQLSDPPRRCRSFLADLKAFLEEHPSIETAPCQCDPKKQRFDFHLKPTLNHRRAIFNTASDPDNLIGEAYRDANVQITRHTGETPAWKHPLVFQLSTGNYLPRQSLIAEAEGALFLKPRAQEMIDRFVLPSIHAGLKTLVVAPKAFQEIESVQSLHCDFINHHHAEGRNDYQDHDIVFIFHYEPDHHSVQQIAKQLYRNPEEPLVSFAREKRTVTVGSVSFDKNIYIDDRVQAVYNRECRSRLMQAAMRLRPNIHAGKIIVFFTAEPVDIPVTPEPFSLKDGESFTGDWEAFGSKRTVSETRTVQEFQEAGVSERTAYRKTEAARKMSKAERDVEIVRRYALGQTQEEIKVALDIGLATVNRVLKKQKF